MNRKTGFWIIVWIVLVVLTGFLAFGHGWGGRGYGPAYGWGRMSDWSEDYRADGNPGWYGMGSGTMRGSGAVYGRAAGRQYGMMGPYGPGIPGAGPSMGPDMGGGAYAMLPWLLVDLTPEQVQKIALLLNDPDSRNRALMQQRWEAQANLTRFYGTEKRDWNAIRAASVTVFDLQRQQLDAAIDLQQKIDALLTDSQRQELARTQRSYGWMGAQ